MCGILRAAHFRSWRNVPDVPRSRATRRRQVKSRGPEVSPVKKPKLRRVTLPRGLTYKAAFRAAVKKCGGDFRGFSYNAKTGKATLI